MRIKYLTEDDLNAVKSKELYVSDKLKYINEKFLLPE